MAPKRSSKKTAAVGARVTRARVSKEARSPQHTTTRGMSEKARRLLLREEQIKEKKKEVSNCRGSVTRMRKKLAAEEAKLEEILSELAELERQDSPERAISAPPRVARRDPISRTRNAGREHEDGASITERSASAPATPGRTTERKRKRLPQDSDEEDEKEAKRPSVPRTIQTGRGKALGQTSTTSAPSPGRGTCSPQDAAYVAEEAASDSVPTVPVPPPGGSPGKKRKRLPEASVSRVEAKRRKGAGSDMEDGPHSPVARMESADTKDPEETQPGHARSPEEEEEPDSTPEPVGLPNPKNACFANSVIQMLSVALRKEQIAQVVLEGGDANSFGYSLEEISKLSSSGYKTRSALTDELTELRQRISEYGREHGISISYYLGRALNRLIAGDKNGCAVGSFLLREVFASSTGGEAKDFDGFAQQDASEYLLQILGRLLAEEPAIGDTLQHELTETITCTCGRHTVTGQGATRSTILQITIPTLAAGQRAHKVEDLLERELATEKLEGYVCGDCQQEGTSSKSTEMTRYPEKLLVAVNRISPFHGGKVKTPLALPSETIPVGTESYRMTAMVQHRGESATSGHYVAFRKHKGAWIELDDARVITKDVERTMRDNARRSSAIILLEKC